MILEYKVINKNYTTLRQVLKNKWNISSRLLIKLKNANSIFVNGANVYMDYPLKLEDKILVNMNFKETSENIVPIKMALDIIYEDDYMLIINKEAGYPIHPSNMHHDDTISNFVKYYFETNNIKRKIRPVNRLDKDTSGITIFAKSDYIQDMLIKQMKENIFKKEYLAITEGIFTEKEGLISAPIARKL